ncbi:N-acetyltransferase [Serinibacter arcticus]|uniref:N-acetyltransferase n=1 Tax=Serinibacter arcticus TaxID=1655435 RepID=A0A2U1ZUY9_9MICO|nr:GNAT family N-acetyltransferase [Serinibacter arcticus]PWD50760.1 N-acetyltransferase [Serinibacter arcticus]
MTDSPAREGLITGTGRWTAHRDACVPDDVARILATLPEWFGIPSATAEYVEAAATSETWTVRGTDDRVVGVLLVERHFPHVAEIHLMAVDRDHRGTGVGRALVDALERAAHADGVALLEVKTLGASHPDPGYARTRVFYERSGFLPLETVDLWGPGTPCLIMVKPLRTAVEV